MIKHILTLFGGDIMSIAARLDRLFRPDEDALEVDAMLKMAMSKGRFDSPKEFEKNLIEGTLLNITAIGSKALSVPTGEYQIWLTDSGKAMLVPTADRPKDKEVYEHDNYGYEIHTKDLMANWNRIERVFSESYGDENQEDSESTKQNAEDGKAEQFKSTVDTSTVDRHPILQAMKDRGMTVTSLAAACGVDPPAISRILRIPKETSGDPGGRNPSMGLASQICTKLRIDPTTAFPDIFTQSNKYQPKSVSGNSQSGSKSGKPKFGGHEE